MDCIWVNLKNVGPPLTDNEITRTAMGTPAARESFHSFFECSQTFTGRKHGEKKNEHHSFISIIKTNICYNNLSLCHL